MIDRVTSAAVRHFVEFARASSIVLDDLLDEDLMAVVRASDIAERVPAHALVDMLQVCATTLKRSNLGAAAAAWGPVRGGYGPLSLLWEYAPTLADALRANQRFIHLENTAIAFQIEEADEGQAFAVQHVLMMPSRYGASQFLEATLTLDVRVARMLLGDDWSPVRIELSHSAPSEARYLRTLFRCPIEFGADRNAIVIRRADMGRVTVNGNAHMFAYLERHLLKEDSVFPDRFERQIEQGIAAHLSGGRASLERIASDLAMGPRTMQRRLAQSGLTFADVLERVRRRTADEYFRLDARPNLTELAYRLGYNSASSASRYLRTHLDTRTKAGRKAKAFGESLNDHAAGQA